MIKATSANFYLQQGDTVTHVRREYYSDIAIGVFGYVPVIVVAQYVFRVLALPPIIRY